jgi:PAS domain S-box-containing protein
MGLPPPDPSQVMPENGDGRFQVLAELAPVGIFLTDAQGICQYVNSRWCALAGLTAAEAAGEGWAAALHPDDRERVLRDWYRAAATSSDSESEYRFQRPDGSICWVHGHAVPLGGAGSQPTHYIGSVVDITEQKAIAEQLQSSQEQLRLIFDTALDAVIGMDETGRITDWNATAARLFGWTAGEAHGRLLHKTIMPERFQAAHLKGLERFLTLGEGPILNRRVELTGLRRDGSEFPVELTVTALRTGNGNRFSAFLRDITDRKRAERHAGLQLRMSQALASADALDTGIATLLREVTSFLGFGAGGFWTWSAGQITCRHFHRDPARVPGTSLEQESRKRVFRPGEGLPGQVWAANSPVWFEDLSQATSFPRLPMAKADGLSSGFAIPVRLGDRVVGVLEFFSVEPRGRDQALLDLLMSMSSELGQFVARQTAEEALREHAQHLEERVGERTAELKRSNEQLIDFAYTISHDLRAPLRAIHGNLDALIEDVPQVAASPHSEIVERIQEATSRMDALLQDLLAYSRMSRLELAHEPLVLADIVREVLAQMEPELEERGAGVTVELPADLPRVIAHSPTTVQAIANLLSNALKFVASEVRPRIIIRGETRGPYVRLSVIDNGIGIDPAHHERIFRVFERLHGPNEYPGTGVGLAMVRRAVERMNGAAGVESASGRGSTFWIELPRAEEGE